MVRGVSETPEKRQKVESAEPCTPQPLTRENLALLEGKMPAKSNPEEGGTSSSKTPNTKSSATDHGKQVEIMQYNGMMMQRVKSMETELDKKIVLAARDIVMVTRDSAMSEKTVDHFIEQRIDRQYANEDTFVDVMWKILIDESRSVKQPATDTLEKEQGWVIVRWDDSALRHNRNQQFRRGSVPVKDKAGERDLEQWLRKLPDVKNPKPDLAYGLSRKAFRHRESVVNLTLLGISDISADMLYPFFVIEFKSGKASFQAATIQACRGGAALIYSMRKLREKAGLTNKNDEDDEGRMVFSMAMSALAAEIYVHWAHRKKGGEVIYEMSRIDGFDLQKEENIPKLRSHIDNILDWGLLKRKLYIKRMLAKMEPRCEESSSEEAEEDDDDENDDAEDDDDEGEDGEEEHDAEDTEDELSRK